MRKYFLFFTISIVIFFAHAIYVKHAIYGDGNGYYTYTQALYYEHGLNFGPIYNHLSNFQGRDYIFSRIFWGNKSNPFPIGTGIIWLPSMSIMSLFSSDRFDLIHELGPGITNIFLMIAGLFFLEKYLVVYYNRKTVFWTIVLIFFGSNVLYYTAFEPALSHQPAFFLISLLLYLTTKKTNPFWLGILSGFLAMIRIPDLIFLIPIVWNIKKQFLPLFFTGFLLAVSPQILNQYFQYGGILVNPYLNGQSGTWQFNLIHSFSYLFSPVRGLFVWTPVFLLGLIGLLKRKFMIYVITIAIFWLVSSSWSAYLSAGFGQRFMFAAIPYFSIGIAELYKRMESIKMAIYSIPFIIWNFTLILGFYILRLAR